MELRGASKMKLCADRVLALLQWMGLEKLKQQMLKMQGKLFSYLEEDRNTPS